MGQTPSFPPTHTHWPPHRTCLAGEDHPWDSGPCPPAQPPPPLISRASGVSHTWTARALPRAAASCE